MFFCEPCKEKKGWPTSISRSRGNCEICGDYAPCYDVPSKYLPMPKVVIPEEGYHGKHRVEDKNLINELMGWHNKS